MNLFELSAVLSPLGGAVGGAIAVRRTAPSAPVWLCLAIPFGLACGFGIYRTLLRLAVGPHDRNPHLPGWRLGALFGIGLLGPLAAAFSAFGLVRLILHFAI
jgi:hypothetical protein